MVSKIFVMFNLNRESKKWPSFIFGTAQWEAQKP